MAIHNFRYSDWDGSQEVPDFTADDVLEKMADDLLRGGDPERALRNLLRRGFQLPDGRRFEGMQRLMQQMREYRQDAFSRYDPNGIVDSIREKLDEILGMERGEIRSRQTPDARRQSPECSPQSDAGNDGSGHEPGARRDGTTPFERRADEDVRPYGAAEPGVARQGGENPEPEVGSQKSQDSGGPARGTGVGAGAGEPGAEGRRRGSEATGSGVEGGGPGAEAGSGSRAAGDRSQDEFRQMLERMLERKEEYLDKLPRDNAGRIRGLREYDFLSEEAREAFERLIGGMQRQLIEQYFQGLKQGIGQITPEQMAAIPQMVRDMNEMLEATQQGDWEAFDRFMEQYRDYFPEGINSVEDLLEHLQRQASSMQALLDSMDPKQRAELQAMMDELLRDDRLRTDLARLGANLSAMGYQPRGGGFPFSGDEAPGFGESLDMMKRLQAMQDLERGMRRGDPFNALANAGGQDPSNLFGPRLGNEIQAVKDMADSLLEAGYLHRQGDRLSLTPRAIRKLGDASLREIFKQLKEDRAGGHSTPRKGTGGDVTEDSRPYRFGDPFHVDIKGTVMNGVHRTGAGTPVHLEAEDIAIFETERAVQHATVLALDMSHSMYLSGLFLEAKKTALALDSLIRGQFPRDSLYLLGFAQVAFELTQDELPSLIENDYVMGTNYEMALALARRMLAKHRGGNRQILFVTDGEPTACNLPGGEVYFNWPPDRYILDSALMEAARCRKEGITINTFVLDPDPRLVSFAQELTAVNKGRMFLAGPYHSLREQVVLDYLNGRTMRRMG